MAKQFINIGIEGNDGTGDVSEMRTNKPTKITELYAVLGRWTDRRDHDNPDTLEPGKNIQVFAEMQLQ